MMDANGEEEKETKCGEISRFFYNPRNGEIMGKTCANWMKLLFFYLIFYSIMIGFFAVALHLFMSTLPNDIPKWALEESSIGNSPGMSFRPLPSDPTSTFLWLNASAYTGANSVDDRRTDIAMAIQKLQEFMNLYNYDTQSDPYTYVTSWNPGGTEACNPNVNPFSPSAFEDGVKNLTCPFFIKNLPRDCTNATNFGYTGPNPKPCILIKLNRIIGWKPKRMEAKDHQFKSVAKWQESQGMPVSIKGTSIYITCKGNQDSDDVHLGPIKIYPETLDYFFFPYMNQKGYRSPFVFLQLLNPAYNTVINVRCEAWSGNLTPKPEIGIASITFQIMVTPGPELTAGTT